VGTGARAVGGIDCIYNRVVSAKGADCGAGAAAEGACAAPLLQAIGGRAAAAGTGAVRRVTRGGTAASEKRSGLWARRLA